MANQAHPTIALGIPGYTVEKIVVAFTAKERAEYMFYHTLVESRLAADKAEGLDVELGLLDINTHLTSSILVFRLLGWLEAARSKILFRFERAPLC